MAKFLTAPVHSPGMPRGIPYIVGNEAAERFSFYGMKAVLVTFMVHHLRGPDGQLDAMSEAQAKEYFHLFTAAAYSFPILGALLSDGLLGKYRTIIGLSIVYCLGHVALAVDHTRMGLLLGLGLIALGAGGIKPCVSAHVGDQFGATNRHLLPKAFGWFYFSINLGAFASSLLTPWLLEGQRPTWLGLGGADLAFGVPGLLMFLATAVFWLGRWKFVHIPAGGLGFLQETTSRQGLSLMVRLSVIYLFVAMFWALFDQTGSAWVLQAEHMDRRVSLAWLAWLGPWVPQEVEIFPAQIQAANPALIMMLIPIFSYGVYPFLDRLVPMTPLRKIAWGLLLAASPFAICALVEDRIGRGEVPHIGWQLGAYVLLTAAEVMVSITSLEFSYTQAPRRMKSVVMALYLLSISLGNLFAAQINRLIQHGTLASALHGSRYYWFFAGCMVATALVFSIVARCYREKTYLQGETE